MTANEEKHCMTMRYPATRWQDALPTGNGIIGALMYGQIQSDVIVLNHDSLYYPKGKTELVDVSDQLPELRRLISAGQYKEAEELMPRVYAERAGVESGSTSSLRDPYQPFCDIRLQTSTDGPFRNYRRGVDFTTGRIWMQWTDNAGAMTREAFISRVCDTVFLRIGGSRPGAVSCRVLLCEHKANQANHKEWHGSESISLSALQRTVSDEGILTFVAEYPNGYAFGAVAGVTTRRGRIRKEEGELVVEGADELVMQVKLFLREEPATAIPRLIQALTEQRADFDTAFAEHSALHGQLFNRMTLKLDQGRPQPNEEMLMQAYDGIVPTSLIQTMFEFGRYLLICSSRPGGWPANLQGIWNGDYSPAWNSDFHSDENIQMNYWQALQGNLPETIMPLFDFYEGMIDDYRENARKIFGCRGILLPIAQTTHGIEHPRIWSNWTAAAGWIGQFFYDYFLFTGDRTFLRDRAVPWLKEVALFYEDFLVEGDDGRLLFSPSISPENVPSGQKSLVCMNATMDVAVCREVLGNLCEACEVLGIESDGVERWRAMLARLPEYAANHDGAMREWLHPEFPDNYHHRHQSHIYPLFPGLEVTEETHPDLYDACRIAVEKRLVIGLANQTGWSMAHMANIYARLGMGNRALECLEILLRSSTGANLFTYHNDWRQMGLSLTWGANPPFQIDANMGIAAAVLEMLVFSKPGFVKLLPALPDKWIVGHASGIACRGGIKVDLEWDMGKGLFQAELASKSDQQLLLRMPVGAKEVRCIAEGIVTPCADRGANYWNIGLLREKSIRIQAGLINHGVFG